MEELTLNQYQNEARRTAPRAMEAYPVCVLHAFEALKDMALEGSANALLKLQDILIWGQGLAGEAGEVCDLLKKTHGHGKPYDAEQMKKELGDVLWYVANLADAHGFTLSDVAKANVDKLRARYPEGWSVERANNRAPEDV